MSRSTASPVSAVSGCVANGNQTVHHVSTSPPTIPDGRISRVRLATMTFSCSLPNAPRWLKCSPTCTRVRPVCCNARYACTVDPLLRFRVLKGCPERTRHGRESLCAVEALPRRQWRSPPLRPALPGPHRSYGLMRRSWFLYQPSFLVRLAIFAGCCEPLLQPGPSQR